MTSEHRPKLLYVAPEASFFVSHRLPLARAALKAGYQVFVACPTSKDVPVILDAGMEHLPLPLPRGARNILAELTSLVSHFRLIRRLRPDLVHLVTAKPILYGGLSARLMKVPSISAITGLGFVFIRRDLKARLLRQGIKLGYRLVLNRKSNHVIFQNPDDRDLFADMGLTSHCAISLIPGSGVDLKLIRFETLPKSPVVVLMPCRMLKDKGVVEFANAARILRSKGCNATFRLLGDPDTGNPTSVTLAEIDAWVEEGIVEWQPHTKDINSALAKAHIAALPSYREGFPKTLVDAAAAGRAAVTTDVAGCRHAIIPGKTGLLCKPRDAESLAEVLEVLITNTQMQRDMGIAARQLAEDIYSIDTIIDQHMNIYDSLLTTEPTQ
jgi:glycosyltransferase involved in cell wall biosynthesis